MEHSEGQDFVLLDDGDVEGYKEDGIVQQPPDVLAEIQKWLQPTDYLAESSEYKKHLNSHVQGTGLWIQETEAYQLWHDSPNNGALWTKAIAGAGKSVFAAMIANKLAKEEGVPVLTFFFRQIIATNHDPQFLVRDWITMILECSPPLQARMKKYMDDRRALYNISTNELWQDMMQAMVSLPKVYCIVDALDEMDIDKQDFFKNLVKLGSRKPGSIKLLMTSRPLPRIEAFLKDSSILKVRLEQLKVDNDIALYVDYRLDGYSDMNLELRSAVKEAIGLKAQGSFLYARLMMDELLDHMKQMIPDIKFIRRSLDWLPLTLEDMYNGMLFDHSLRSQVPQPLQLVILRWVTHSSRPLRLLELATMLDSQNKSDKATKDTKSVVRAACGPLLEILEDETISVIHHSFTEFLIDSERTTRIGTSNIHPQFPVIDSEETHDSMALACLKYLGSGCLKDWKREERDENAEFYSPRKQTHRAIKMSQPFLDYAMNNWYVHVRKAGCLGELLLAELDNFMQTDNGSFESWIDIIWTHTKDLSKISPMHVASWAGMSVYVKHLAERGHNLNDRDNFDRTPLSWAAAKGHAAVVSLLLDNISDPDLDDDSGLKPLHYAAQVNHHEIVKLLLAAGVKPLTGKTREPESFCGNSPSTLGESSLLYACRSGSTESVKEMITYLEDKDLDRALCWAAEFGKAEIVDLLLALPQVSPEPAGHSDTPLFLASCSLHYQAMQSLLKAGADPNKRSSNCDYMEDMHDISEDRGPTPLHGVCGLDGGRAYAPQSKCFELLKSAGSNINAVDKTGKTPLHHAVIESDVEDSEESLSKLLLDNGADPTILDDSGNTPLHLVPLHKKNSGALIDLLLARGASLDVRRSKDGRTPVHTMLDCIHELDIKALLPHVKDWNVRDECGDSPLHILLSTSYHRASGLQDLLDAGADLLLRNKAGDTALHAATKHNVSCLGSGSESALLPTFIAAGVDLETRDRDGRTFLMRIASSKSLSSNLSLQSMKYVLGFGVDINARDYSGDDCLHLLCRKIHDKDLVESLVAAGADPLSINHAGNTLLHEVFSTYTVADADQTTRLTNYLLDAGLPAGARNHLGQTPFHLAMKVQLPRYPSHGRLDQLGELFKSKVSKAINVEDNRGIQPLHLAVTTSEILAAKLIAHGANAKSITCEDLSSLHIAARAGESNTIGYLLEHFSGGSKAEMINLRDTVGRTALHYACRSGRPESVAILLKAGANPDVLDNNGRAPLHACAEFEQEKLQHIADLGKHDPLRMSMPDAARHNQRQKGQRQRMWDRVSSQHDTTRVREIIRLLIDHGSPASFGAGDQFGRTISLSAMNIAISEGAAEMVDELDQMCAAAKVAQPFQKQYLIDSVRPALSKDYFDKDGNPARVSNYLLSLKQHRAIEDLTSHGADFSPRAGRGNDFLTTLARYGYASLLEKLGGTIQKAGWVNGIASPSHNSHEIVKPYLITAAYSELPNLDMIKLLVGTFGADVNIQPEACVYRIGKDEYIPGETALHILCRGDHWWQAEAVNYLLSQGANIELRNERGQTPLDVAVSNESYTSSYRHLETAQILLEHGANPNVMDENGLTCLNKAMHDIRLIKLLIKYGADITFGDRSVLFSAITAQDVDAVAAMLESGANCNAIPKPVDHSKLPRHEQNDQKMHDSEYYLLHYAAMAKFNTIKTHDTAVRIIKLLLKHGANPYSQYAEGVTVVHDIIHTGGIIRPFLEIPDLQLEQRDGKGRTLFLAACLSSFKLANDFQQPLFGSPEINEKVVAASDSSTSCRFLMIYEKGANLTAVDNEGNNGLHLMVSVVSHNHPEFQRALGIILEKAPYLLNQKNAKGNTPLHVAMSNSQIDIGMVDLLVKLGADPLDKDEAGKTPLHYMTPHLWSSRGSAEWVSRLKRYLDLGISIDERDNAGESAVFRYFAAASTTFSFSRDNKTLKAHRKYYQALEDAGADLFIRNNTGETLLHIVAKQSQHSTFYRDRRTDTIDTFKFLMENGLDPMTEDTNQRTPLDVAAACGNDALLALFRRDKSQAVTTDQDTDDDYVECSDEGS